MVTADCFGNVFVPLEVTIGGKFFADERNDVDVTKARLSGVVVTPLGLPEHRRRIGNQDVL